MKRKTEAPTVIDRAAKTSLDPTVPEEITDPKLLARVRQLTIAEHAGVVRRGYGDIEDACIDPGCSCNFDVCGRFRNPPVRCTSFEEKALPLNPDLEKAYWNHLHGGKRLKARRCAWKGCRREAAGTGPDAKWCSYHAEVSRKKAKVEYQRQYRAQRQKLDRESKNCPSEPIDNHRSQEADSQNMIAMPPRW